MVAVVVVGEGVGVQMQVSWVCLYPMVVVCYASLPAFLKTSLQSSYHLKTKGTKSNLLTTDKNSQYEKKLATL